MKAQRGIADRIRQVTALVVAATFLGQNYAWAICSDGSTVPAEGFVIGKKPVANPDNWSSGVFTGTTGSLWIPDTSVYEHNDPSKPLTGGGHNWVFDQGATLCKVTDTGRANALATGWAIEPNFPTFCVILPVIRQGLVTNIGDVPIQGDAITPTCDPSQYVNNDPVTGPALATNTYFNHLGCSISHGVATTPQTATTFLFVAGKKSGMFSIPLDNVTGPVVGGEAGKTITAQNYFSQIPSDSILTSAAVSKDGQFAIATSKRNDLRVWGCLNPLGNPGDPTQAISPFFFIPDGSEVLCMQVGSNNLQQDLTTVFGPDNQPYFGGQRVVNTFDSDPGSSSIVHVTTAWPNCIWQTFGLSSVSDAFVNFFQNGCGSAQPNFAFTQQLVIQPQALLSHGKYMYAAPNAGTVYQFLVTVNPITGFSEYQARTLVSGLSLVTGLGVDDAHESLFIYSDPTGAELSGREFVTKMPLCEDMDGETVIVVGSQGNTGTGSTGTGTTSTGTTRLSGTQLLFALLREIIAQSATASSAQTTTASTTANVHTSTGTTVTTATAASLPVTAGNVATPAANVATPAANVTTTAANAVTPAEKGLVTAGVGTVTTSTSANATAAANVTVKSLAVANPTTGIGSAATTTTCDDLLSCPSPGDLQQ